MNLIEKFGLLEERFLSGAVSVEELRLGLEPLLRQVSKGNVDERVTVKVMNDLELVLFTLPAEEQSVAVAKLLGDARAFLEARVSGVPSERPLDSERVG